VLSNNEARECTVDYIISCFPNNAAVYHDGKLLLHQACEVKASQDAFNKIFNVYPNAIMQKTTNNKKYSIALLLVIFKNTNKPRNKENCYVYSQQKH